MEPQCSIFFIFPAVLDIFPSYTRNEDTIKTYDRERSSEGERWPQQYSKEDDVFSSVPVAKVPEQRGEDHVAGDEGRLQQAWLGIVNCFFATTDVKAIPIHIL